MYEFNKQIISMKKYKIILSYLHFSSVFLACLLNTKHKR